MVDFSKILNFSTTSCIDKLYELEMTTWTWKLYKPSQSMMLNNTNHPKPRLGASLVVANNHIVLFGGLGNQSSEDDNFFIPYYFNDVWKFKIRDELNTESQIELTSSAAKWEKSKTYGVEPIGRESHKRVCRV